MDQTCQTWSAAAFSRHTTSRATQARGANNTAQGPAVLTHEPPCWGRSHWLGMEACLPRQDSTALSCKCVGRVRAEMCLGLGWLAQLADDRLRPHCSGGRSGTEREPWWRRACGPALAHALLAVVGGVSTCRLVCSAIPSDWPVSAPDTSGVRLRREDFAPIPVAAPCSLPLSAAISVPAGSLSRSRAESLSEEGGSRLIRDSRCGRIRVKI